MTGVRFERTARGGATEGWAAGTDRVHLRRLRRGQPEPDWEIDLHGLTAREARAALRAAIAEAYAEGARCGLVIHGRGHGSEAGAVLREGVPEWLTAPPTGARVLAFTPALPRDGGEGATYVLLRRLRAERD